MAKTKEQLRQYNREKQREHRQNKKFGISAEQKPSEGIDDETQIDSVIREMAELQVGIDNEKELCQQRISLIQKYSDEQIEPYLSRLMFWEAKLRKFVKKQQGKRFFRGCRFGNVSYYRGKLKIQLNADLAKKMMGKP